MFILLIKHFSFDKTFSRFPREVLTRVVETRKLFGFSSLQRNYSVSIITSYYWKMVLDIKII